MHSRRHPHLGQEDGMTPRTIAALYIDPRGPYPKMEGVDCWDESRDARLYDGPHPVVAHPPCGPWSKLRHLCKEQTADCGTIAIGHVLRWGGVLEHPAHSLLWRDRGLPPPGHGSTDGHINCVELNQVSWGHPCAKPTWLLCVGVPIELLKHGIRTGGAPTHCVCTGPRQLKRLPVASKPMKRRTPPLFAEWLVSLARSVEL
jgi:hypothetical protein